MYRSFGAPELLREEEAIDVLCTRVVRLRRLVMRVVVTVALAFAFGVLVAAAGAAQPNAVPTDKVLGLAFAGALFGGLFAGHAVGARLTSRCAVRWAVALAKQAKCDEEPLVDAARLLAGGHR